MLLSKGKIVVSLIATLRYLKDLDSGLQDNETSYNEEHLRYSINEIIKSIQFVNEVCETIDDGYPIGPVWARAISLRDRTIDSAITDGDISCFTESLLNFHRRYHSASHTGSYTYDYLANKASLLEKLLQAKGIIKDVELLSELIDLPFNETVRKIATPPIGNDYGMMLRSLLIHPNAAPNYYFAHRVKQLIPKSEQHQFICEIGGEYGNCGYHLINECDNVTYINVEIREIYYFSAFFLLMAFPDKKVHVYCNQTPKLLERDFLKQYDIVILPSFVFSSFTKNSADIVFNNQSFCEMSELALSNYIKKIEEILPMHIYHNNGWTGCQQFDSETRTPGEKELNMNYFQPDKKLYNLISLKDSPMLFRNPGYKEAIYCLKEFCDLRG